MPRRHGDASLRDRPELMAAQDPLAIRRAGQGGRRSLTPRPFAFCRNSMPSASSARRAANRARRGDAVARNAIFSVKAVVIAAKEANGWVTRRRAAAGRCRSQPSCVRSPPQGAAGAERRWLLLTGEFPVAGQARSALGLAQPPDRHQHQLSCLPIAVVGREQYCRQVGRLDDVNLPDTLTLGLHSSDGLGEPAHLGPRDLRCRSASGGTEKSRPYRDIQNTDIGCCHIG